MPLASRVITLCSYKVSFQITIIFFFSAEHLERADAQEFKINTRWV